MRILEVLPPEHKSRQTVLLSFLLQGNTGQQFYGFMIHLSGSGLAFFSFGILWRSIRVTRMLFREMCAFCIVQCFLICIVKLPEFIWLFLWMDDSGSCGICFFDCFFICSRRCI